MTTFKEIRGTAIEVLSSDPSNPELGQIWYNSSSGTLKGYVFATVNAWASGGNLNTGRESLGGTGTQTAALAFAGGTVPTYSTATESYNGTSWTSLNPVNTGRGIFGNAGTQGASFMFGGQLPSTNQSQATENWNGTSWSNGTNYPAFGYHKAAGTQTAAITLIGQTSPDGNPGSAQTYPGGANTYNGTSYSSSPSYNTGRRFGATAGTQTAALYFGGMNAGGVLSATESYNGTSWTTVNSLNQGRSGFGGAGTQTATLGFAGFTTTFTGSTEQYDGTSWVTAASMATARQSLGGAGTQTLALAIGGNIPGPSAATEEFTGETVSNNTKTITTS